MSVLKLNFLVLMLLLCVSSQAQSVWTIGPMLHFNFERNNKISVSYGIEAAYWNFERSLPLSADLGIEFAKKRVRVYSEFQTGVVWTGVAIGPVVEYQSDSSAFKFGVQGSVWANIFLGINIRGRYIDNKAFFCPGGYLKIPFAGNNLLGNNNNNNSFDWD